MTQPLAARVVAALDEHGPKTTLELTSAFGVEVFHTLSALYLLGVISRIPPVSPDHFSLWAAPDQAEVPS